MYTIKNYIDDIKTKAAELEEFLSKFDSHYVQSMISLITRDDFFEAQRIISNWEDQEKFNQIKSKLAVAKVIEDTDSSLDIKAYSLLSKVLCSLLYCKYHKGEDISYELETILFGFSELNPHKEYLKQIYDAIEAGSYNDYLSMMSLTTGCFLNYPNTVIKVVYNRYTGVTREAILNELKLALVADGNDIVGLRYLKALYIPQQLSDSNKYYAIMLYDGGMLYEADSRFTATTFDSYLPEAIVQNQHVLDSYPENQNLQLKVNENAASIEPIYVNNPNQEGVYLNINYPFVLVQNKYIEEILL